MTVNLGMTRNATNLHSDPGRDQAILEVLPPNTPIKVLSQQEGWLRVRPYGGVAGYVLPSAVVLNDNVNTSGTGSKRAVLEDVPAIPGETRLDETLRWIEAGGRPPWIAESYWEKLVPAMQDGIVKAIGGWLAKQDQAWQAWVEEVRQNGRLASARIEEWITILRGGKNMWALWGDKLYRTPSSKTDMLGWINPNDIVTWTGRVKKGQNDVNQEWYEIALHRLDQDISGWFGKWQLLDDYEPAKPENDPNFEENSEHIFDLNVKLMRFPNDPEIAEAIQKGFSAAQYIDLATIVGRPMRHFNLCGIFGIAALAGQNVVPTLKKWRKVYRRANDIIQDPGEGTSLMDLKSLLNMFEISNTNLDTRIEEEKLTLLSPKRLAQKLQEGKMLVAGVTIKSNGKISQDGNIRHWVIVQDALPAGNNGWVRIYNPFHNWDETYPFRVFSAAFNAFGNKSGVGLWVKHTREI